jgi:hypothetical protein
MKIITRQTSAATLFFLLASFGALSANASGSMTTQTGNSNDAYSMGKSIFFKQVVCTTCPYAGRGKDAADAKALRDQLNMADSKLKLGGDDKQAVNAYLSERFRLSNSDKK